MDMVTLGRTGITVNKNGFGALPIQRVSREEAARLLRMALDAGITFFDTARFYTDSEEKIGYALSDRRDAFYLATKPAATTAEGFWSDLETSLRNLKTDYIDIYQFHNPAFCPKPGDGSGLYEAMLEARRQGKIRFISITNHRMTLAHEAIRSGRFTCPVPPDVYMDMIYMPDALRACVELMEADPAKLVHRNSFNIASMSFTPEIICAEIRKRLPDFTMDYDVDPVKKEIAESWPNSLDDTCAREEWGWKPEWDLSRMTDDMLAHIRTKLAAE